VSPRPKVWEALCYRDARKSTFGICNMRQIITYPKICRVWLQPSTLASKAEKPEFLKNLEMV
jgi:hypothetical protein